MGRVSPFLKAAFICLLLSGNVSSDDLLNSVRFTRNALQELSRVVRRSTSDSEEASSRSSIGGKPERSFRPSNKMLETENEIEKAEMNAEAIGGHRLRATRKKYFTLARLFENSVNSNCYSYARDVFGQLLYLHKTESLKRRKRSTGTIGQRVLQRIGENLGLEKFNSFMAVNGNVSLMFVIDDTGSMDKEIKAVKNIATAIVKFPRKAPVEYILSPFNDPMTDAAEVEVKDNDSAEEFVQAINNLTAHKGGDCPEYSFQGMLNALELADGGYIFNSHMYVFTDAGPKDAKDYTADLVKEIAILNNVKINIFSTGSCGGGLHPAFLKIANETSGKAMLFIKEDEMMKLGKVMGETLKGSTTVSSGSYGSSLIIRGKRSSEREIRYRFPVDDSMETLIVYVTTTRETYGHGIILRNPNGTIITAEKLPLSIVSVYHIIEPAKGSWTLEITEEETGEYEFYIESSSKINVDFKVFFMIPLGRGRWKVEVPFSNPIAGKVNKMALRLFGGKGKVNTSSLHLHIVTESGDVIFNFDVPSTDNELSVISFTPPTSPFKVKLSGTTQQGHRFEREYPHTIKPTTAVLRGKYASNDFTLPLSKTSLLHFQICNFGASERFDIVARNDTMGYIQHPSAASQRPKFVLKDRCISIYLRARATRPADVNKMDTVVLKAKGKSSGVEISAQMRLLVDDIKG